MRRPGTHTALEDLGRVRLARHFAMRNFLYTGIGNFYERASIPDLAIAAGRKLVTETLDPLVETFGPIGTRSGYRSPDLNHFGATEVKPQKCSANHENRARRIWDQRDDKDRIRPCIGASHCIYKKIHCIHNPASGRETLLPMEVVVSETPGKKVVVVGGGPAHGHHYALMAGRYSSPRITARHRRLILLTFSTDVGRLLIHQHPRRPRLPERRF